MIPRPRHAARITALLQQFPVVAIVGARQVGKSTLARMLAAESAGAVAMFDLEAEADRARLAQAALALEPLRGLIIIDEIQHQPGLFATLRVLADRPAVDARFLVLGSASPELLRQGSESLAGRVAFHELPGLDSEDVGVDALDVLWIRGGFPRSFLAVDEPASVTWREEFVRTFLERDLPALGLRMPAPAVRRFWTMLAHLHGQRWNAADIARSLDASETTARRWLDVLCATFMVRRLQPWFTNTAKRQVKTPKVYFQDTGLLHVLLGLHSPDAVLGHPRCGASWEGFAMGEAVAALGARPHECHFWALHSGAELDLLVVRGNQSIGIEFKRTDAPRPTHSMRAALETLALDELVVIHAGEHSFPLADRMRAVSLRRVRAELAPLG